MWSLGSRHEPNLWKGLLAGTLGGIGGTLAMTAFQNLWMYVDEQRSRGDGSGQGEGDRGESDGEPATVKAAVRVSEGFFGHELSDREKRIAGQAVHWGYGTSLGAAYGAAVEYSPEIAKGQGLSFGAGAMAISDEVAVPALGLSSSPKERPLSVHAYSLCSHLVYGLVLESIRKAVRRGLA